MNLPLPGGGTAVLRDRLDYLSARNVRAAFLAIDADRAAMADLDLVLVRAYVESWDVLDSRGQRIAVSMPQRAPDDVIQTIAMACLDLWNGAQQTLPKAGKLPLLSTPPARRSRS